MLPRISSDQILALLQSGDKAFLSGAGNRGNRFPIVFHAQNDPVLGDCFLMCRRVSYGGKPTPGTASSFYHQSARGPHAPYQPNAAARSISAAI
jgi:hypothetical protein